MRLFLELEQGRDRRKEQSDRGGYPPVSLFKETKRPTWTLAIKNARSTG